MNSLNVVGVALNLMLFVIVAAGVLAMLDERKINCLQALFYFLMEALFVLNIFFDYEVTNVFTNSNWNYPD